jgi:hypothetical protein
MGEEADLKKPARLTKKPLRLTLFYPATAIVVTLIFVGFLALAIGSSHVTFAKGFAALAVSFLFVSLASLIGDQGILNRIASLMKVDADDDKALGALKDGKAINLLLTALFQIIYYFMIMVS